MKYPAQRSQPTIESLVDDQVLDEAWQWLCRRRKDYTASSDIWWLRQDWATEKPIIIAQLRNVHYQFAPLQKLTRSDGEVIELWSARDALVLKALSIVLGQTFEVSPRYTHVKGHGGAKAVVREVAQALADYRFVFRTDAKSFYASIDHHSGTGNCASVVKDKVYDGCCGNTCVVRLNAAGCIRK